jgi:hypothetical protein
MAKCHSAETHSARNAIRVNATFLKLVAANYVIILVSNLATEKRDEIDGQSYKTL